MKKKRIPLVIVCLLALIAILVLLLAQCAAWADTPMDYETRDISQYGIYVGHSEEFMEEYIGRFFPEKIEEYFEDVTYVFKSRACDTYGFEAMLEFTIGDEAQFQAFVAEATEGLLSRRFPYDPAFREYVVYEEDDGFVHDVMMLGRVCCRVDHGKWNTGRECLADPHPGQFYSIDSAKIAKILVDQEEHRIVFVAFGVHDGGGSSTDFFCEYFDRFGIDPKEYEALTYELDRFDKTLVTRAAFVTVAPDGAVTEQEVLDPERYEAFFGDFFRLYPYYYWKNIVETVTGPAVLLTFEDGSHCLFNHECTICTINGQQIDTRDYYVREEFADFWNRYCSFEYDLP